MGHGPWTMGQSPGNDGAPGSQDGPVAGELLHSTHQLEVRVRLLHPTDEMEVVDEGTLPLPVLGELFCINSHLNLNVHDNMSVNKVSDKKLLAAVWSSFVL